MNKTLIFLFFISHITNAQVKAEWANEVLFTSNLSAKKIANCKELLGKPNTLGILSDSACTFALSFKKTDNIQTIRVRFATATQAQQLVIAQNYFSGAIKNVIIFDSLGNKRYIYASEPRAIIKYNYDEYLGINTPQNFKIKDVEIVIDLNYLEAHTCQIDAIGLVSSQKIKDIEYLSYMYCSRLFNPDKYPNLIIPKTSQIYNISSDTVINQAMIDYISKFEIHWAEERATASSGKNVLARNVLGKPIFFRTTNIISSWQPKPETPKEWVKVGYSTPQTVSDVFVFKNISNYGFDYIELLDSNDVVKETFTWNDNGVVLKEYQTLWHLSLDKPTTYKVSAIRLAIDAVFKENTQVPQIDAIGIANEFTQINEIARIPGDEVQRESLNRYVNSDAMEVAPIISLDGKTLFFTRQFHEGNVGRFKSQDVWVATMGSKDWQKPINIGPPINTDENNAVSMISPNAKTLYLLNIYKSDGTFKQGLSTSKRTKDAWSFPAEVKIEDYYNASSYAEFSMAPNRKVLLMTIKKKDTLGEKDLYVSFLKENGNWSKPVNMGKDINTLFEEAAPFVAADNRTLYFSSDGHSGYGKSDIFMTERLDETWLRWTKPVNLGPKINTKNWDGYFTLTASGEYAYTASDNPGSKEDIFRIKLPANIQPKPVVLLRGKIEGSDIQQIEATETDNGQESYLADYDPETGEYVLILPVNKKYNLSIKHAQNAVYQDIIDLFPYKIYTEMSKDIDLRK